LVEVQPESPQGLGTRDAVDRQSRTPLKFSDHSGGAWPEDAVDDQVGVQRIVAVQPGLQEPDKIVAVTGSQYNCRGTDATPNHVQL
jgi:hypothetical protein